MKRAILGILSGLVLCGCNVYDEPKKSLEIKPEFKAEVKPEVKSKVQIQQNNLSTPELVTLFSTKSSSLNKAWVGTFQLVWNDMKNSIIKHDIEFVGEEPTSELIGLNNEEFNSSMLNESSYYKSYGKTSPEARDKIEKDIKKKFNETSDVLHKADWSEGIGKYYAYAMIKKEFEFYKEFDELENSKFNGKGKFKYFGIKNGSDEALDRNVRVLFYNNENDYAIQLLTKSEDIVYLYKTEENADFKTLYQAMKNKEKAFEGDIGFNKVDTLKIPNIKVAMAKEFPQLCNKAIKDTNPPLMFSLAIETLQFELDKKGGKVKSEALIATKNQMIAIDNSKPRHFDFDKTFVMFLVDSGKQDPYVGLRIEDLSEFQK